MGKQIINLFIFLALLTSCGGSENNKTDSATSGSITITADEGLKPIIDAELAVFESLYPEAHIKIIYTNEKEAIDLLCKDSARIAIVTRDLLPAEKKTFDDAIITPRYSPVAYDAIAVILNPEINDSVFTTDQLTAMLNGKYKTWKDINPTLSNHKFNIVFDHSESGIVRYCNDSLL